MDDGQPPSYPGDHTPSCAGPRPHGATPPKAARDDAEVVRTLAAMATEASPTLDQLSADAPPVADCVPDTEHDTLPHRMEPCTYRTPDYRHWPFPARCMDADAATLYDAARTAAIQGQSPPSLDHTTSLDTEAWITEATGHPADEMILRGIKQGFSIQYAGPPLMAPPAKYNHQSAEKFPAHIDKYVQRETEEAALSGPYHTPPFTPWFVASPIMSREKSGGDGRRIIVDLSFPNGGINQYIAPHVFDGKDVTHNLPTVTSAVATIAAAPPGDVHMAVIDLSRAYRQFPVNPLDWPLLGIYWKGAWSFDRRLPFGCRMSSFCMQSVAEFIIRALTARQVTAYMYLDDIIAISPTKEIALRDYNKVLALLQKLGLAIAAQKLQPPATAVIWLGIRIDVDANQLSIPPQKLGLIKDCMAAAADQRYLTKKHLQRLIGLANHLTKVVRAARTFICRLLAALRGAASDHIRVTREIRADLAWYANYLSASNGRAIIPTDRIVMRVWADACLKGAGASDGKRFYEHAFSPSFTASHHIAQLEGLNCLAAVRAFVTPDLAGGTIEIMCDNRPSVDAFTSGRARDEVLAACARALWFQAAKADIDLRFTHVPGEAMALPDALSRSAIDASGRARADYFIAKLSLRRVRIKGAHFNYKAFL